MRKLLHSSSVAALFISTLSLAQADTTSSLYLGGQFGMSNTHNVSRDVQTTGGGVVTASPSNTGGAGRIFAGYNFNEYAAIEGGYTHYAASTYDVEQASCGDPQIRESGWDLVGKGTLPYGKFGAYGKAGISYMRVSLSGSLQPSETLSSCSSNGTTQTLRPTAGIGASYSLNPQWLFDLSYSRVFGGSNVKDADFAAFGVTYRFVDVKCGQFLC